MLLNPGKVVFLSIVLTVFCNMGLPTFSLAAKKKIRRTKRAPVLSFMIGSTADDNPWAKLLTPAAGSPVSIGNYDAGCLQGAEELQDGPGYLVMHRERHRYYGHPETLKFIKNLGEYALESNAPAGDTLMIGDVAMIRGGPTLLQHHSHQTGLDVDIWFKLWRSRESFPQLSDAPLMVNWNYLYNIFQGSKTKKIRRAAYRNTSLILSALSPEWTKAQENMVLKAAMDPRIERIFVDPVIKKKFCSTYPEKTEALKKLRPMWYHWDHFHVRLACPEGSPDCVRQPPQKTDGCHDGELEKLFAHVELPPLPGAKNPKEPVPSLPKECETIFYKN